VNSANPPLSCALDRADRLDDLKDLGFRWVTFVPVYTSTGTGPALEEVADAVSATADAGFGIQIEPQTPNAAYFEPEGEYVQLILAPLFGIAAEAERHGVSCAFSFGSEVTPSVSDFALRWEALVSEFRDWNPRVALGYNMDPEALQPSTPVRKLLNDARASRGLPALDWRAHRERLAGVHHYLGSLDYVGFHFRPALHIGRSNRWWAEQTTEIQVRIVGRALLKEIQTLISRLRRSCGDKPQFVIGRFEVHPNREPAGIEARRKYYLGLLDCLRRHGHLFGALPVTLSGGVEEVLSDRVLCEAIREYNKRR
jgi:hypothetical protein